MLEGRDIMERIQSITHIVIDKTGTLTKCLTLCHRYVYEWGLEG